jgi:hypothetical protein
MMPLTQMARSVFFSFIFLGAIDLDATEQPELAEPEYTRTRELPPLKISFADMQAALAKAANLLSSANAEAPRDKKIWLHETLRWALDQMKLKSRATAFPQMRTFQTRHTRFHIPIPGQTRRFP